MEPSVCNIVGLHGDGFMAPEMQIATASLVDELVRPAFHSLNYESSKSMHVPAV